MVHAMIPTTQPITTPKTLEEPSSPLVCAPSVTLDDMNSTVVDVETDKEVVDITDVTLLS